jgi:uncharacterized repeat protein (TIGR01451 family)
MNRRNSVAGKPLLRLVVAILALLGAGLAGLVATASSASAATTTCGFANPGSGTYAQTLCWFDLSGYDAALATSGAGQPFTVNLPSGYTLTFTLNVTGTAVHPVTLPTFSTAFLGRGAYTGISGDPALYQSGSGVTTATESNITMTDPGGSVVTDYSLVGADAESTDTNENIGWTSAPGTLTSLEPLGNACSGGFTGVNTTSVLCSGSAAVNGVKTGAAILASEAPTSFVQSMKGGGLQAFAFGVLVAGVELNKTVVNGFSGDSFGISATNGSGTVVGSDNTNGGTTASTGVVTLITSSTGEEFTLAEDATSGTLANYDGSWSCTRNGAADATLPTGDAGASNTVTLGVGDLVDCTITNTAKPVSLSLTKHAGAPVDVNNDGLVDAGDTIAYTFDVTNTGNIAINGVGVADAKVGPVSCPQPTLAPGASETCATVTPYTITAADVTAGSVDNTATASGSVAGTGATTVISPPSSTSTPTTAPAPSLTVAKSVLPTSVSAAGQSVTYSFLITNTGNVTLTGVTAHETAFSGTGTPPVVSCPPGANSLVPTASVICTATYTATQADVDAGSVSNTARASGKDPANNTVTSSPSSATFTTTATPALTVVKSASSSGGNVLHAGDVITYSFVITNTGNVTLSGVDVNEGAFTGTGTMSAVTCPPAAASLTPGDQVTCTATYTVTQADVDAGNLTNSATAIGTPPGGVPDSVTSPPSTVVVPATAQPALTVKKTASPTTFSKVGQPITYSFLVTNTGDVTITDTTVVDTAFTGTGTLSAVSCPGGAMSMLPGAQVTCTATYTVTQADLDAGSISNTATASGNDPSHGLVTSPPSTAKVVSTASSKLGLVKSAKAVDVNKDGVIDAGDRIDWTLVATNLGATTIKNLKISDSSAGKVTCPKTTLAPGASVTCTVASHTVTAADVTAGHVTNVARASGTVMNNVPISSPPAHATVDVHATPSSTTPPSTVPPSGSVPPSLPFTGFAIALPLKTGAVALVLGVLLMFVAEIRRRSV